MLSLSWYGAVSMSKYTIGDAIRMVGHLLEHNGITGPFYADKDGNYTSGGDSTTCRFCMAGAIDKVCETLGLRNERPVSAEVVRMFPNSYGSRVIVWEGDDQPTTPEERLAIARKLQAYNG
jgi:hypothetical protein